MAVAKLCTNGNLNAMKSEEGNDSLDTFIRRAIGKEPLIPFSRSGDNPVQWVQLFNSLDQPDVPGWPMMTPIQVQMQKCEKCSREFCSPINYRRHIRVHRRSLNVNKESHKIRDLLAAFWDELSLEDAKEVVSFNDLMLKGIPGSSIIKALESSLRKPGVWTLPPVYVKAGSTLLDIIQAKPLRLPISSQELFGILDDASERTFLCAGTAESVQTYIFDGEATKNSLELKNLVASISFLFEQQLVKAWVTHKDIEALRCQKLLVEEEEAAQKRQAKLLERKKQKKLRQKEQRMKEIFYFNGDLNLAVDPSDGPTLAEESGSSSPSGSSLDSPDLLSNSDSCLESMQLQSKESGDSQTIEPEMVGEDIHPHLRQSEQGGPPEGRDILNESKVSIEKYKTGIDGESLKPSLQGEISHQIEENNCEVIIGSISIKVKNGVAQQQYCHELSDGNVRQGDLPFSGVAAKEFLADRWKDAVSADHVKLVLAGP